MGGALPFKNERSLEVKEQEVHLDSYPSLPEEKASVE